MTNENQQIFNKKNKVNYFCCKKNKKQNNEYNYCNISTNTTEGVDSLCLIAPPPYSKADINLNNSDKKLNEFSYAQLKSKVYLV